VGGMFSVMVTESSRSTHGPANELVNTGMTPTATMSVSKEPMAATTRDGRPGTSTVPLSLRTVRWAEVSPPGLPAPPSPQAASSPAAPIMAMNSRRLTSSTMSRSVA